MEKYTNALSKESSPYLLQHAHNPVDWVPWSDDIFMRAERENKLVLISIGYSSCHWCHVMEKESFEDDEVAALMNKFFINVKIDREERPDIDQVYMTAVQLMTQRGGWPLNCITLPNGDPIYGGTYFPKDQWMHILKSLAFTYKEDQQKVLDYGAEVREGVQRSEQIVERFTVDVFEEQRLEEMIKRWSKNFDLQHGGKSSAPKFPLPSNYEFLLDYSLLNKNESIKKYVHLSLTRMAQGGIFDQIGGGFSRYSVDMLWKVPHFEKMLYDNAQLIGLYSKAYLIYGDEEFKKTVRKTVSWLQREMKDRSGAYYSALDADSEGVEGAFYVWKKDELESILRDDYNWVADYYCVDQRGYWEENNYILLRRSDDAVFAKEHGWDPKELNKKVDEIDRILLKHRDERIRPGLDSKCLTSWNALLLKGLSEAYAVFHEEEYLLMARDIYQWILGQQMSEGGTLQRTYSNGVSKIDGFLEDYALTISGLIAYYQVTFDTTVLDKALEFTRETEKKFFDHESGMFFFTEQDSTLIARKMEVTDNVIPSSNSVMARNLYYLSSYYSDFEMKRKSIQMLKNVYDGMEMYGSAYSNWGIILLHELYGLHEIVVSGKQNLNKMREIQQLPIPFVLTSFSPNGNEIPLVEHKVCTEQHSIFICTSGTCFAPTNDVTKVLEQVIP